jgi:hypothetical protein
MFAAIVLVFLFIAILLRVALLAGIAVALAGSFLYGLDILLSPPFQCDNANGCFVYPLESVQAGWFLVMCPVIIVVVYLIHIYGIPSFNGNKKIKK